MNRAAPRTTDRHRQQGRIGDHAFVIGLVEAARTLHRQPLLHYSRQRGRLSRWVRD